MWLAVGNEKMDITKIFRLRKSFIRWRYMHLGIWNKNGGAVLDSAVDLVFYIIASVSPVHLLFPKRMDTPAPWKRIPKFHSP